MALPLATVASLHQKAPRIQRNKIYKHSMLFNRHENNGMTILWLVAVLFFAQPRIHYYMSDVS